jgi:DNA-binding protein HU-alpha
MAKTSASKPTTRATKSATTKPATTKPAAKKSVATKTSKTPLKRVASPAIAAASVAAPAADQAADQAAVLTPNAIISPDAAPVPSASSVIEPKLVTSTTPVVSAPEMKKRDLLEKVVKRSGIKKKDAKPVVEAMLAVMGEALAEGRELNLPPFGKLKTNRVKETGNARILNCKLRQGGSHEKPGKEALAETDD